MILGQKNILVMKTKLSWSIPTISPKKIGRFTAILLLKEMYTKNAKKKISMKNDNKNQLLFSPWNNADIYFFMLKAERHQGEYILVVVVFLPAISQLSRGVS